MKTEKTRRKKVRQLEKEDNRYAGNKLGNNTLREK